MGCTPRNSPLMRRCCRQVLHILRHWRPSTWSSMEALQHTKNYECRHSGACVESLGTQKGLMVLRLK